MKIEQLYDRGRLAYLATFSEEGAERLIGTTPSLAVVTRADFVMFPELCLEALQQRASLYMLGHDGSITAMLCRHQYSR